MQEAVEFLRKAPRDVVALTQAKGVLDCYENSEVRDALLKGDLEKLRAESCCPDGWRDDNDQVRESEVAKMVTKLVGSFPMNVPDPEVFVPQMIEDVHSWQPGYLQLDTACRELRLKQKFMPAIAELHKAYEKACDQWRERWDARDFTEGQFERLTELVALVEKAPLIRYGDRVRHVKFGAGMVVGGAGSCEPTVAFDNSRDLRGVPPLVIGKVDRGRRRFRTASNRTQALTSRN
jgi:hypothetical protein